MSVVIKYVLNVHVKDIILKMGEGCEPIKGAIKLDPKEETVRNIKYETTFRDERREFQGL